MSILKEYKSKSSSVLHIAEQMLIAARTAPKAKGRDTLEMFIVTGDSILELGNKMQEMGESFQAPFFSRDAENIKQAEAIVVIGTRIETLGLNEMCQLCGFDTCKMKELNSKVPCSFNVGDLNLAIGSAAALASDLRIDNRIMFTIGKATVALKWFETDIKMAMGIPLSATSKNPFFDRK